MKRGKIAIIMVLLSLIAGGIEYVYTTMNTDACINILEDAQQKMEHNEVYEAGSAAQRLEYRFKKQSKVFNIFMYHSETGDVSNDLAMLTSYAETGSREDFLAVSARVMRELLDIRESKELSWENIM